MDPAENFLFAGGDDGSIYETRLFEKSSQLSQTEPSPLYCGHTYVKVWLKCFSKFFILEEGSIV